MTRSNPNNRPSYSLIAVSRFVMTNETNWSWTYENQIPSDPNNGVDMIRLLIKHLEGIQWTEKDCFAVHLAMEEAVMNAIKHGNSQQNDKFVSVVFKTSDDELFVCITDEGEGFDPDNLPDPTTDENLEIPSGRGVMLMRSFMDSVRYNRAGNSVEMSKKRSAS